MTTYRSRKDGSHYPISKHVSTGTMSRGTAHLGVPKRVRSFSPTQIKVGDTIVFAKGDKTKMNEKQKQEKLASIDKDYIEKLASINKS